MTIPSGPTTPPGTPPPTSDPEGAKNRRSDKFIALIGVIGVIVGGSIGAGSSYFATSAQSRENLDNYRRDQRTETYAQISAALDKLTRETYDLTIERNIINNAQYSEGDFVKFEEALDSTVATLTKANVVATTEVLQAATTAAYDQLYLVGESLGAYEESLPPSPEEIAAENRYVYIPPASRELYLIMQRYTLESSVLYVKYGPPNLSRYENADVEEVLNLSKESRVAFIEAARADLDLDD